MFRIKAKLIADRVNVARAGSRARRQPTIVLGTGAVIKLAPGRSVDITPQAYKANKTLLDQFSDMITVTSLSGEPFVPPSKLAPPPKVDPSIINDPATKIVLIEKAEDFAPVEEEPKAEVVEDSAPIEEEPKAEVVEDSAPIEEEPKPKKRRRRKKKVVTPEEEA